MAVLSWNQVHAWRLSQHFLLHRAGRDQMLDVVSRICGLHAQMMSAAELSLWARADGLKPDDVQNALWRDRTLVKLWAMRGTLHLLTAQDYPLFTAAFSTFAHFRRASWLKYTGVTLAELDELLRGVQAMLTDEGMTRGQLADALAERLDKPKLRDLLLSGWGMLLKPASFQGLLCFGENQGQNVTFVRPDLWLGDFAPVDPDSALAELARRFLTTFAPATIDEFGRWLGIEPAKVKRIFKRLGDEIIEVDVEGWQGWVLRETLAAMQAAEPADCVRLLPHFDPYTLAVAKHSHYLLADEYKARVYRQQGWISPVVLVDGRIAGVWEIDKQRSQVTVHVDLFASEADGIRQGIESELTRLGAFLGNEVRLV